MSKLHLHLRKRLEQAILKHEMLSEGDRVLVGVSGGADSLSLLKLLTGPMLFVPKPEYVLAVHVDLGFDGTDGKYIPILEKYFKEEGYNYRIEKTKRPPRSQRLQPQGQPLFLMLETSAKGTLRNGQRLSVQ